MSEPEALSLANASLVSAVDLAHWLRAVPATKAEHANELSLRLSDFQTMRADVRDLLEASIAGDPLPAGAVERLNETSARIPRVARLESGEVIQTSVGGGPAPLMLARISWSAMELLGGPDRERLRLCGACGRYFVATRPDRVWCSDRCGNRIRVARHHARTRSATYAVRG